MPPSLNIDDPPVHYGLHQLFRGQTFWYAVDSGASKPCIPLIRRYVYTQEAARLLRKASTSVQGQEQEYPLLTGMYGALAVLLAVTAVAGEALLSLLGCGLFCAVDMLSSQLMKTFMHHSSNCIVCMAASEMLAQLVA